MARTSVRFSDSTFRHIRFVHWRVVACGLWVSRLLGARGARALLRVHSSAHEAARTMGTPSKKLPSPFFRAWGPIVRAGWWIVCSRVERGGGARRALCSLWFLLFGLFARGRTGFVRGVRWLSHADSGTTPGDLRSRRTRARNEPGPPLRRPARGAGAERLWRGRTARERSGRDGARGLRDKAGGTQGRADFPAAGCPARPGVGELRLRSGATNTLYRLVHFFIYGSSGVRCSARVTGDTEVSIVPA